MDLSVICPYCGKNVPTDLDKQTWASSATEILAVPLIERIGRLATTKSWASKGRDPRLGGILSIWNNTVGLLRGFKSEVKVMKRELTCASPDCKSSFDCYVNLDPQHSFSDFWPHLTGKTDKGGCFTQSEAKAGIEKLSGLGERIGISPNAFIVILVLVFGLFTFLPNVIFRSQQSSLTAEIIFRSSVLILIILMLWLNKNIAAHIRSSLSSLKDLFIITNQNGFHFWHNFTLGRVTGISFPKKLVDTAHIQGKSKIELDLSRTTISQASAIGGLPCLILGLIIWIINYLPYLKGNFNLISIIDLLFWLVIMYITGVTAWIGFNVGVFVLQNMSLIPMRLTPLNNFDNLAPVKKIAELSLYLVIPVVLLPLLILVAPLILPGLSPLIQLWLLPWIRIALGMALLLIGVGDSGIFILGLIYVGLLSIMPSTLLLSLSNWPMKLNDWISLGVFGVFLSILVGYHLSRAFGPLKRLAETKKQEIVNELNRILTSLSDELAQLDKNSSLSNEVDHSSRDALVQNIVRVIDLRAKVLSTRIDILGIRTGIGVVFPFISSILLPFALEVFKNGLSASIIP